MATALAETIARTATPEGRIYQQVLSRCREQRELILEKVPRLNRFLTGYDLRHVFSDYMQTFDLTRLRPRDRIARQLGDESVVEVQLHGARLGFAPCGS